MQSESFSQTVAEAEEIFAAQFGGKPQWIAAAPGRVNLIGGHVDYNDGVVLPLAIDRYTVMAAAGNSSNTAAVYSQFENETLTLKVNQQLLPESSSWRNYVIGVLAEFQRQGNSIPGFNSVICSGIPVGAGLASSAALEVATATLIEAMLDIEMAKTEKALLCHRAEHDFASMPCGVMDQFASVFAEKNKLVKLDCKSLDVELVSWPTELISVLIFDSRASHQLVDGEYALRRSQCASALSKLGWPSYRGASLDLLDSLRHRLDDHEYRRARHVLTEMRRCDVAVGAIMKQDWRLAGRQLFEGHASLRDDFQVSCPELDLLVETARQIGTRGGIYGMRMTGGGFGGSAVTIVDTESAAEISDSISTRFESAFGVQPGSFATLPAAGAFSIKVTD